jgi:hypothetical protein
MAEIAGMSSPERQDENPVGRFPIRVMKRVQGETVP